MPRHYYGTVSALAWILNHYFYGGVHYSWLAAEFHPLRTNPKSSNPYLIYGDLYSAWAWRDGYDKFVNEARLSLHEGVEKRQQLGTVGSGLGKRLARICRGVPIDLFYPVVYRVDLDRIGPERRLTAGSGTTGSREYLVPDLRENEFDLLLTDYRGDPVFRQLVLDELSGQSRTLPSAALAILERMLTP